MREAHPCLVCGKRIPLCVRSDRRFCTVRCRVWAFRHPGQRRPDYARGRVGLPPEPGRGRPKTLAETRAALEETRRYAAQLAATARQQHAAEQKLLKELSTLREGMAEVKRGLAAERDAAREDLARTKERLGQVEEQRNRKTRESHKRRRQTERLLTRLKRTEKDAEKSRAALGRAQADLTEARRTHTRHSTEADLLRRRLEDEQARRIATEQRLEQLLGATKPDRDPASPDTPPDPVIPSDPAGLYQRQAAAAGYNYQQDPLFALMRHEVLLADRYATWQARHMGRIGARHRDRNQPLEDQAYAATLSTRWRLVDHPHLRLGTPPQWRLLGFLLDERSERYLLTIAQERLDEIQSRIGEHP